MLKLLSKFFPSKSQRDVQRLLPIVEEINKYYEQYQQLSDEELKEKTEEFRARIRERTAEGEQSIAQIKEQLKNDLALSLEERRQLATQLEELQASVDEVVDEA